MKKVVFKEGLKDSWISTEGNSMAKDQKWKSTVKTEGMVSSVIWLEYRMPGLSQSHMGD